MNQRSVAAASRLEFVFGGTFDPVHLGHLAIIEQLQKFAPAVDIRLIPCAIPPLKAHPASAFEHRAKMLQLATASIPGCTIDCRESERESPSYSLETLQLLQKEHPDTTLVWVMGMDSLADFQQWHRWQEFAQHCHLLVFNRKRLAADTVDSLIAKSGFNRANGLKDLENRRCGSAFYLQMPEMPQSSTEIRRNLRNSGTLDTMLPQSVIEYIRYNHLYE